VLSSIKGNETGNDTPAGKRLARLRPLKAPGKQNTLHKNLFKRGEEIKDLILNDCGLVSQNEKGETSSIFRKKRRGKTRSCPAEWKKDDQHNTSRKVKGGKEERKEREDVYPSEKKTRRK